MIEWSRRKADETAERDASGAIVTPWRQAMGWAWWLAPLTFCGALTLFGTDRLMKWPSIGAQIPAPAVASVVLLMTLPTFGLLTALMAPTPKILRVPLLVMLVVSLLIYRR